MGLGITPEIKMARKLHKKHSLSIPVDLKKLVSEYAQLIYKTIPIEGIDGVCLNLKNPKKSTKIIVNNKSSHNRQRFTLAHELGHIIIPWHLGTIIDSIDNNEVANSHSTQYWNNEREANRFASELLMPFDWLYTQFLANNDLNDLIPLTSIKCKVSEEAARIRVQRFRDEVIDHLVPSNLIHEQYNKFQKTEEVQQYFIENTPFHPLYIARKMVEHLKGKIAFCIEKDEIVIESGSTNGTHNYSQFEGNRFKKNPYPYFKRYTINKSYGINTHWWDLSVNFDISEDQRNWKDILDTIANDLVDQEKVKKFKSSINGTLSGINGNWKRKNPDKGVEEFIYEVMQRYNNVDDLYILKHPDFSKFVRKRSMAFFGIV